MACVKILDPLVKGFLGSLSSRTGPQIEMIGLSIFCVSPGQEVLLSGCELQSQLLARSVFAMSCSIAKISSTFLLY